MSDEVVFDEPSDNLVANVRIVQSTPTGMLAWLIKNKYAKNGKSAERLLLIAVGIIVVVALATLYFGTNHSSFNANIQEVPGPHGTLVPVQR